MYSESKKVTVIIPALNEEESLPLVLRDIPRDLVGEIVVVDNGSTDNTFSVARDHGATVLKEDKRGYGSACWRGIEYIKEQPRRPEIIVFLDADYSDYPEEISLLVKPILEEGYDMVLGSRITGRREKGSMTPQSFYGNKLGTFLMKLFFGFPYTDLGPFRAIKYDKLMDLNMQDRTYGWTVEMQIKAAKKKYKIKEAPVNYRVRIGKSKVSGTVKGTLMASYKILLTIFKYLFSPP
ncbi:MAG: glycosyltransferase family 2 protein [Nitrospirae bacterium]|nr:glycosyltransferase family 2 protein [Nitrospirota bacterium]